MYVYTLIRLLTSIRIVDLLRGDMTGELETVLKKMIFENKFHWYDTQIHCIVLYLLEIGRASKQFWTSA